MLAGNGLGDHPCLGHAAGEQNLAHGVVDLVRAGVEQVLALEVNLGSAQFAGQPLRQVERRGASAKLPQVISQFPLEFLILLRAVILLLQLLEGVHKGFRHVTSAVRPKTPVRIRQAGNHGCAHGISLGQACRFGKKME